MAKVSITHVSNTHSDWGRALKFYKDELGMLRERLTEIAGKNTAEEVSRNVEHFENQFKIQNENIDQLLHDIHCNIVALAKQQQISQMQYVTEDLVKEHAMLNKRFTVEEATVNTLRQSFNKFAAVWM